MASAIFLATTSTFALTGAAFAEEEEDGTEGWSFEGEFELGVESVLSAPDPDEEINDVFLTLELEAEAELTDRLSVFTALTLESITDAEDDRAFEDIGLYVGELGLAYDLDPVTLKVGKLSPVFGSAWETAPGYFGDTFAEDYELEEMIGLTAEIALGDGVLSLSAFYPDDTALSNSWGTRRGRNRPEDGDVGNTGTLNNFALQYDHEWDNTTLHFGLRHLAQGEEDNDENGIALGFTHAISDDIFVMGEWARFDGWEGGSEDATVATLGAAMSRGPMTYSAVASIRDVTDRASEHMITLGVDYVFDNDILLSVGVARTREEEEDRTEFALNLTIPLE